MVAMLSGCCADPVCKAVRELHGTEEGTEGEGGGRDAVTAELPFSAGYSARCVQGAGGTYSHSYQSTRYDLDLDTPNDRDDPLFAPADGVIYVHAEDPLHDFGIHANVDLGDGTYLLMGHGKEFFPESGTEVVKGEYIGTEGTTGNSSGDHVHYGRHSGDAEKNAAYGTSIDGFAIHALDLSAGGAEVEVLSSDAPCDLSRGHVYESLLTTPHMHPVGTLVRVTDRATVFLVTEDGVASFHDEDAFLSRGYDFNDVVRVTGEELACYAELPEISGHAPVRALRDSSGEAWLLTGDAEDADRARYAVPSFGFQGILKTYGIRVATYDDIDYGNAADMNAYPDRGTATYRDGSLISPTTKSDVYVVTDGVGDAVDSWQTFLFMGFAQREVMEIPDDEITAVLTARGNCAAGIHCITKDIVSTCGGETNDGHDGEDSGVPADVDSGDSDDPLVDHPTLALTYEAPGTETPSRMSLSGEYVASGVSEGWQSDMLAVSGTRRLTYVRDSVESGDTFRFSVEYTASSMTSWSCLSPFPPGEVVGTATASVDGVPVPVVAVADPTSTGCGLMVTVP